ncbi:MAG: response regulator [Candidatus Omnitrophica bacterium]|nr:response regulator [Candidatus Omnitrophota bacterium]
MKSQFDKKLRVLLVENSAVDCKVIDKMLQSSPYGRFESQFAGSLEQAFILLAKQNFDVVLLDLNVDDCTGLETLKRFHRKFPHMPVVVNTGSYQDDLGLKAITKGAQDYLIKGMYKSYVLVKSLYYAVERKKAEEELKGAYNKLQQTQTQLIQAEKMNVIGGLASGVAHEVKNPLATILYGVEYLNTALKSTDEKVVLTLESIKEAAKSANGIIKGLLDFASLTNLKKEPENINILIDQAVNLIRPQCERINVELKKDLQSDLPLIKIDCNRIKQVVVDLIVNALYAMSDGGCLVIRTYAKKFAEQDIGWVDKRSKSLIKGEDVVIVDFDDTGPGIKAEYLIKIFDPFFTTRRASGGIGLGLSIARTIMNSHGGVISLQNKQEGGAIARLIFKANKKGSL